MPTIADLEALAEHYRNVYGNDYRVWIEDGQVLVERGARVVGAAIITENTRAAHFEAKAAKRKEAETKRAEEKAARGEGTQLGLGGQFGRRR
jgi:hypothetical protein